MRKKFLAAFIVAAGVAFTGYNMMQAKNDKNTVSDLLMANMEALASGGEIGTGVYKRSTFKCPPPVEYKTGVSCSRGGSEDCNPSDC